MPDATKPLPESAPAVLLAARFLLPLDERLDADSPGWRTAGRWFVLWGVVIGIVYALVFGLTWRYFGEYQFIRWVPTAAVLIADLGFCGYRLLFGAANVSCRHDANVEDNHQSLTLAALVTVLLVVIVKCAILISLPRGEWASPPSGAWDQACWTGRLGFLYPMAVYRPLILMPIWGRWAASLALSIGRCAPGGSARLRMMADGARLPLTLLFWLLVTALTVLYCGGTSVNIPRALAIALGVLIAAYLSSFMAARRAGGQTEATVCLTGLAAELAFLALYRPVASTIYWY